MSSAVVSVQGLSAWPSRIHRFSWLRILQRRCVYCWKKAIHRWTQAVQTCVRLSGNVTFQINLYFCQKQHVFV